MRLVWLYYVNGFLETLAEFVFGPSFQAKEEVVFINLPKKKH